MTEGDLPEFHNFQMVEKVYEDRMVDLTVYRDEDGDAWIEMGEEAETIPDHGGGRTYGQDLADAIMEANRDD